MAINKKLIHFNTFKKFNSLRLSANAANTKYTRGVNGAITDCDPSETPDILYQSIVYIKDTQQQWTHGLLYSGSESSSECKNVYTFNYTVLSSITQEEWDAMQLSDVIQLVVDGVYTPVYVDKSSKSVSFLIMNNEFLFSYFYSTSDAILIAISKDLQVSVDFINKTDLNTPIINTINKNLSLSDTYKIRDTCKELLPWLSMTFMISDSNGNCSSRDTVYIDTEEMKLHLFHSAANEAVRLLFTNGEAYYYVQGFNIPLIGNVAGGWYSQSISKWINLPETPLKTARVGDFITFTRVDVPASDFYSKYIDFDSINLALSTTDRAFFDAYKSKLGLSSLSDGLFIKFLIVNGYIRTSSSNPKTSPSALLYPLAVDGMVTTYVAQITPNTENFYSGLFWTENMTGPGIYSYITKGRPAGSEDGEFYTGYVSPDGTQTLVSMKDPSKVYTRPSIKDDKDQPVAWTRITVGKNSLKQYYEHLDDNGNLAWTMDNTTYWAEPSGEVFNDYINNYAHPDHAHAEGLGTKAYLYNAHAEGFETRAGHNAHSEGALTKADGQNSHTEGYRTIASGNSAHAEGFETKAEGTYSHAEGAGARAKADFSHAEGYYTVTNNIGEHAEGRFNYYEIDNLIHSVGIGDVGLVGRINAHAITSDGKHYIYGIGGYKGEGIENATDLATSLNNFITVKYSELVALRDSNKLSPGKYYRITDYVTTTFLKDTLSSKHPFDIIVTALTNNTLSENAKVCLREGDTYFENNNLEAWEIKYCLDNDTSRFAWTSDSLTDSSNVNINLQLLNGNKFINPFYPTYYIYVDGINEYVSKSDFFVEFGRETSPEGLENLLCIYKTTEEYEEEGADYPDKFFYCGKEEVDGVIYDKWQKNENGSWLIGEGDTPSTVYVLTDPITVGDISYIPAGKGVIYYMKDEYNNECPYDFKNIMFKTDSSYFGNNFYYTFSQIINSEVNDLSLNGNCYSNIIKEKYENAVLALNNNVLITKNLYTVCLQFVMNVGISDVLINLDVVSYNPNNNYETRVARNSSGEIKIYCEADLIL